jgi:hypothetical protein
MEEEITGQNRLFVILAISLIGLLVLGLVGIGGVFIIRQNLEQQAVASRPTPTLMPILLNATATFTPAPPKATNTPLPTPTNTPVLAPSPSSGGEGAASNKGSAGASPTPEIKPSPTRTPVPGAAQAGATNVVPETGIGGLEAVLITIGLTVVLFVARRLRTAV